MQTANEYTTQQEHALKQSAQSWSFVCLQDEKAGLKEMVSSDIMPAGGRFNTPANHIRGLAH